MLMSEKKIKRIKRGERNTESGKEGENEEIGDLLEYLVPDKKYLCSAYVETISTDSLT